MLLTAGDWVVIALYGLAALGVGLLLTPRAGRSMADYFVAGRTLPWWVAGTSMAATWFAADAPLATAGLVRERGIYANWLWWYEGTGVMLLVFFYAKLWRRAQILTDAEFIEIRYSGRAAAALRGFTAVYQGVLKNAVVMGWVMLAMVKFAQVLLGWTPALTLGVCVSMALVYTAAAGLWGVVATDLMQFVVGMIGSIILATYVFVATGGPAGLAEKVAASANAPPGVLDLIPQSSHVSSLEMFSWVALIGFLWVRSGQGDGYLAQRLFASKNERQSMLSALWFSIAGIALMTWPWVIVGLGSLVLLPMGDPTVATSLAADPELAYPMMIGELLPAGLRGLLVAAFLAAFMSTMDTHLCWGASYLVNDLYRRFIKTDASEEHYVRASRVSVGLLALVAAAAAWQMTSIQRAWIYVIELTAGVAFVWLLRWFWWRVNAWAEIAAMAGSLIIANGRIVSALLGRLGVLSPETLEGLNTFYGAEYDFVRALTIVGVCTLLWVVVALVTPPDDEEVLDRFYERVRPGGWWSPVQKRLGIEPPPPRHQRWLGWAMGVTCLYSAVLGVGYWATGRTRTGIVVVVVSVLTGWITVRIAQNEVPIEQ